MYYDLRAVAKMFYIRSEADSAAMRGQAGMQLGNNGRQLLVEGESGKYVDFCSLITFYTAERKMREAMTKDREAKDLERLALDGERNIHRLCDQLLVNGRQRGDVEKERKLEENRVSEMAASLERSGNSSYKLGNLIVNIKVQERNRKLPDR